MLIWDKTRHALGVEAMDAMHCEFVALAAELAHAQVADFPRLFDTLIEHTQRHFDNESALMRRCKFFAIGEHESEHRRVLGELARMRASLGRGRTALARNYVANGLPDWFAQHLATMDAALAACVKRAG